MKTHNENFTTFILYINILERGEILTRRISGMLKVSISDLETTKSSFPPHGNYLHTVIERS